MHPRHNQREDAEIAHTDQGFQIPGRVINLDQARVQHGDRADHMVRMRAVGDPPADAVIVEIDALGKEGRRIVNAGLAHGLESLTERPPAITALLQQVETMPATDLTEGRTSRRG